jgi:hypothetical protein
MKIELLDLAQGDLIDGYRFYESQEAGLGSYFLDTLYSDIDPPRHQAVHHIYLFGMFFRRDTQTAEIGRQRHRSFSSAVRRVRKSDSCAGLPRLGARKMS